MLHKNLDLGKLLVGVLSVSTTFFSPFILLVKTARAGSPLLPAFCPSPEDSLEKEACGAVPYILFRTFLQHGVLLPFDTRFRLAGTAKKLCPPLKAGLGRMPDEIQPCASILDRSVTPPPKRVPSSLKPLCQPHVVGFLQVSFISQSQTGYELSLSYTEMVCPCVYVCVCVSKLANGSV